MFSIVIPVFNKKPHLERCFKSILNQRFRDYEIIFVCDPSVDGSTEHLKLITAGYENIHIFNRKLPGAGGYAARNLGIANATRDWIAFLDADDAWSADHLEKIHQAINSSPNFKFFASSYVKARGENIIFPSPKPLKFVERSLISFCKKPNMQTSGICMHKTLLEQCGGFPAGKLTKGGDVDTFFRAIAFEKKYIQIKNITSLYYVDAVSMVTKNKPFELTDYTNTFLSSYRFNGLKLFTKLMIVRRRNIVLFHMIKRNLNISQGETFKFLLHVRFFMNPIKYFYYLSRIFLGS